MIYNIVQFYYEMKIVIDGNIGCGKTTIIKRLNDDIRIPIFLEPLHKWQNLLTLFYTDPGKWAFPFNLEVLTSFNEWKYNTFPAVYERSPLSCKKVFSQLNYESGHIHPLEMNIFEKIYNSLAWDPDVLIYIRTDPKVCVARMQERARECEKGVQEEYIRHIHNKYDGMVDTLLNAKKTVYIIDGNRTKDDVYSDVKEIISKYVK